MPSFLPTAETQLGIQLTGRPQQRIARAATLGRWLLYLISALLWLGVIGLWIPQKDFFLSLMTSLRFSPELIQSLSTSPIYLALESTFTLSQEDFMLAMVAFLALTPEQVSWLDTSMVYRLVGFVFTLVPFLLLLRSLSHARHILASFTHGYVLTLLNAMRLRSIAGLVAAFGVAFPMSSAVIAFALTINNPPEQQIHSLYLAIPDVMLLGLGLFLWLLSWAMVEAARVIEENNSFI